MHIYFSIHVNELLEEKGRGCACDRGRRRYTRRDGGRKVKSNYLLISKTKKQKPFKKFFWKLEGKELSQWEWEMELRRKRKRVRSGSRAQWVGYLPGIYRIPWYDPPNLKDKGLTRGRLVLCVTGRVVIIFRPSGPYGYYPNNSIVLGKPSWPIYKWMWLNSLLLINFVYTSGWVRRQLGGVNSF